MDAATVWFVIASILIILELFTGTFYLLVFGCAALVAAGTAYIGLSLIIQYLAAALLATIGVLWLRGRPKSKHSSSTNNLDQNQPVEIINWLSSTRARVRYRGTEWDAKLIDNASNTDTHYLIHETLGNTLIIKPTK
jgi:membrane protein implicated in regulation of membrane protease activity